MVEGVLMGAADQDEIRLSLAESVLKRGHVIRGWNAG